jgi:hypothetical protein
MVEKQHHPQTSRLGPNSGENPAWRSLGQTGSVLQDNVHNTFFGYVLVITHTVAKSNFRDKSKTLLLSRFNYKLMGFKCFVFLLYFTFCSSLLLSQKSATVIDRMTGHPIPYVNIWAKNSTTGTTTDLKGEFQLDLKKEDSLLVISVIGYEQLTIPATKIDSIIPDDALGAINIC